MLSSRLQPSEKEMMSYSFEPNDPNPRLQCRFGNYDALKVRQPKGKFRARAPPILTSAGFISLVDSHPRLSSQSWPFAGGMRRYSRDSATSVCTWSDRWSIVGSNINTNANTRRISLFKSRRHQAGTIDFSSAQSLGLPLLFVPHL